MGTHYRLTGARRDPGDLPAGAEVIEHSHTERQSTFIVRSLVPIDDPSLTVEQLTLEDLVLAYLSRPVAPHRPELETAR
jgi:ABC-2 type transport system ATP-binding protein